MFVVSIGGRDIRMARRTGRIDYVLQQISAEEYARRIA